MATVVRVRKLVNPRTRRKAKGKHKSNPKHRRRLTPAQIRAGFGGNRARAAMKAARKRKRTMGTHKTHRKRKSNPKRSRVRVVTKTKYKTRWRTRKVSSKAKAHRKRSRRASNPLLVTFGPAINPKRRRKTVAKKRKKSRKNPSHRSRTRVVTKYRYRARPRHHKKHRAHRNPGLMAGGVKDMGTVVLGGLVGVTINKTVTAMLPSSLISSPLMRVAASAAVAWGAGEVASRMIGPRFGHYVFFGGLMQAGSLALNAFLPTLGGAIGLAGLVPSNDILLPYNAFAGRGALTAGGGGRAPSSVYPPPFA